MTKKNKSKGNNKHYEDVTDQDKSDIENNKISENADVDTSESEVEQTEKITETSDIDTRYHDATVLALSEYKKHTHDKLIMRDQDSLDASRLCRDIVECAMKAMSEDTFKYILAFYVEHKDGMMLETKALRGVNRLSVVWQDRVSAFYTVMRAISLKRKDTITIKQLQSAMHGMPSGQIDNFTQWVTKRLK